MILRTIIYMLLFAACFGFGVLVVKQFIETIIEIHDVMAERKSK